MARLALALLLTLALPVRAAAEDRVYIWPMAQVTRTMDGVARTVWAMKYLSPPTADEWKPVTMKGGDSGSVRPLTDTGWGLLFVAADPETISQLDAVAEAYPLPADLETRVGGAAKGLSVAIDAMGIPSTWVGANLTWLEVVRALETVIVFDIGLARENDGKLTKGGVTLQTRLGDLPPKAKAAFATEADRAGLAKGAIHDDATVADVLVDVATQGKGRQATGPRGKL